MNIPILIVSTIALSIIGGGLAYGFWIFTRPKKLTWKARVYTVSDSTKTYVDENRNIKLRLNDLQPYCVDVLEKIDLEHAREVYRLQKVGKTTPAVTNDCVERWGRDKEVKVLLHNNSATLLKSGYDVNGHQIFNPINYDTQNMTRNEIVSRKAKLHKEKDILEAIAPYISIGIASLMLFGVVYLFINATIDYNKEVTIREQDFNKLQIRQAEVMRDGLIEYGELQKESAEITSYSLDELQSQINDLEQILSQKINISSS